MQLFYPIFLTLKIVQEVIVTSENITVRILEKVSVFHFEGKTYVAGDVLTIPQDQFVPYIMEVVEPKPEKVESSEEVEQESTEESVETTMEESKTIDENSTPTTTPETTEEQVDASVDVNEVTLTVEQPIEEEPALPTEEKKSTRKPRRRRK